MQLRNLSIPTGAVFAPMAGLTDAACRHLMADHGAAWTVSEMASAKALNFHDEKSLALLRDKHPHGLYAIQLFGAEPESMAKAILFVREQGIQFDILDINMGCPAPKITGSGAGSRLLLDPPLCGQMVAAARKALGDDTPLTVKMRIGWDADHLTGVEVAKQLETTADEALTLLEATGCDGVMIGRGALGDPWLFAQVRAALLGEERPPEPTLNQRMTALRDQIYEMCEEKGEWAAMPQARSQAMHYMKGLHGAAALRRSIVFSGKFITGQTGTGGQCPPLRLSKKVRSPLGPLCEGAPPAGGGGENCTAARNISGYGKVLSLRPFGAPPSQREVFRHAAPPLKGETFCGAAAPGCLRWCTLFGCRAVGAGHARPAGFP